MYCKYFYFVFFILPILPSLAQFFRFTPLCSRGILVPVPDDYIFNARKLSMDVEKIEGDIYRTATRDLSFFARLVPSVVFYTDIISIVVQASRKAKRNRYEHLGLVLDSMESLRALERVGVQLEITA